MSSRFLSKSMTEDVFKAPRTKRSLSKSESENCYSSPLKRPRTRDDFFAFCNIVLQYTQYEAVRQEEMRAQHNFSPLDSVGSTAESYTSDSTSSSFSTGSHSEHSLHHPESLGVADDSWDLITCHCLKPYAGRPMIECSECETWIHWSCAKIRKSNIPDTFVCQLCRDSKLTMRKSSRSRTETKRVSV